MKKMTAMVVFAAIVASSTAPASAGGTLSAEQHAALEGILQTLLDGPPPANARFYDVEATPTLSTPPYGRTDCVPIQSAIDKKNGRAVGVAQRWRCPHIATPPGYAVAPVVVGRPVRAVPGY